MATTGVSVGSIGLSANVSMTNLSLDFSGEHKLLSSSDFMKVTTDDFGVRLAGAADIKRSNELLSSDFQELRGPEPEPFKQFLDAHRGDDLDQFDFAEQAAREAE